VLSWAIQFHNAPTHNKKGEVVISPRTFLKKLLVILKKHSTLKE